MTSIGREVKKTSIDVFSNHSEVMDYEHRFPKGHWSFVGPGTDQKCYGTHTYKPEREWNRSAEMMMLSLRESEHPVFWATSALDQGFLKSKNGGKLSIHFSGDLANAELLSGTTNSVNQLSIHGALAEWYVKLAEQISAHASSSIGKPIAPETDVPALGSKLRNHGERFENLPEDVESDSNWRKSPIYESSFSWTMLQSDPWSWWWIWRESWSMPRVCTPPRDDDYSVPVGWIRGHATIGPVRQVKVTYRSEQFGIELK